MGFPAVGKPSQHGSGPCHWWRRWESGLVRQRNVWIQIHMKGLQFFVLQRVSSPQETVLYLKPCDGSFRDSSPQAEKAVGAAGMRRPQVLQGWVQTDLTFPSQGSQLHLDLRPGSSISTVTQDLLSETLCLSAAEACLGVQPLGRSAASPVQSEESEMQEQTQEKPGLRGKGAFCCHSQAQ